MSKEENKMSLSRNVTILKVLDPSQFLIREIPCIGMSQECQNFRELETNFLHCMDSFDIIPMNYFLPSKGKLILVRCNSKWYRGQATCVLDTMGYAKVGVFLVDYGKQVTVAKEDIRIADEEIFQIPFQAKKFVLINIQPLSLGYREDLVVERMPSASWDTSAKQYVTKMVIPEQTSAEIKIYSEDEMGVLYGELIIDRMGEFLNLNEALVAQKYAWFDETPKPNSASNSLVVLPTQEEGNVLPPAKQHLKEMQIVKSDEKLASPKGRGSALCSTVMNCLTAKDSSRSSSRASIECNDGYSTSSSVAPLENNANGLASVSVTGSRQKTVKGTLHPLGRAQKLCTNVEKQLRSRGRWKTATDRFVSYPG